MNPEAPLESVSNEELAAKARCGCAASFELLVRRFQVPLLRFLRRRVTCDADAEDLLQEAFIRAYHNLAGYRSPWRFSTWLFTIAHRVSVSHQRRVRSQDRRVRGAWAAAGPNVKDRPIDALATTESRKRLWDIAASVLTDEQFAAIWLYYVEGFDTRQLSRVLGKSWVSVKTMLFRARSRLTPFLRDWIEDEWGIRPDRSRAGSPAQCKPAKPQAGELNRNTILRASRPALSSRRPALAELSGGCS